MGKIKIHLEEETANEILSLLGDRIIEEKDLKKVIGLVHVYEEIKRETGGKIKPTSPEKEKKKRELMDTGGLQGIKIDEKIDDVSKP